MTKLKQPTVAKLIEALQKLDNKDQVEIFIFCEPLGESLDISEIQVDCGEVYIIAK